MSEPLASGVAGLRVELSWEVRVEGSSPGSWKWLHEELAARNKQRASIELIDHGLRISVSYARQGRITPDDVDQALAGAEAHAEAALLTLPTIAWSNVASVVEKRLADPPQRTLVALILSSPLGEAANGQQRSQKLIEQSLAEYQRETGAAALGAISVARTNSELRLEGATAGSTAALEVARVLLGRPGPTAWPRRRIDLWATHSGRYWALGGLALTFEALAFSFASLHGWAAGGGMAIIALLTTMVTVVTARQAGARVFPTLWGLAIPVIIVGFAAYYAHQMAAGHIASSLAAPAQLSMADALMLSLSVATTSGFLDLALQSSGLRRVAFTEMLLVMSVAGASVAQLAIGAWGWLRTALAEAGEGSREWPG
jgi:hypothetical protein